MPCKVRRASVGCAARRPARTWTSAGTCPAARPGPCAATASPPAARPPCAWPARGEGEAGAPGEMSAGRCAAACRADSAGRAAGLRAREHFPGLSLCRAARASPSCRRRAPCPAGHHTACGPAPRGARRGRGVAAVAMRPGSRRAQTASRMGDGTLVPRTRPYLDDLLLHLLLHLALQLLLARPHNQLLLLLVQLDGSGRGGERRNGALAQQRGLAAAGSREWWW